MSISCRVPNLADQQRLRKKRVLQTLTWNTRTSQIVTARLETLIARHAFSKVCLARTPFVGAYYVGVGGSRSRQPLRYDILSSLSTRATLLVRCSAGEMRGPL
jgi:hypothetical protein